MKRILLLLLIVLLASCGNSKNSNEFMDAVSGNYLFNSDESIGIAFVEGKLNVRWRDNNNIEPLKVNDSTFYIQEMNERFIFVLQPKVHIVLAEKGEHKGEVYTFPKMQEGEKTPGEYLLNNEYDKALEGYLAIQKKDSLDITINANLFNRLGYRMLNDKKYDIAIKIFKIGVQLHPKKSNPYYSLGEGYWRVKDTTNAVLNFKKALSINPENRRALNFIKDHKLD